MHTNADLDLSGHVPLRFPSASPRPQALPLTQAGIVLRRGPRYGPLRYIFRVFVDLCNDAHQSLSSSAIHLFKFEVVFEATSWTVIAVANFQGTTRGR